MRKLLIVTLCVAGIVGCGSKSRVDAGSELCEIAAGNGSAYVSTPQVPEYVIFAGDTVWIDTPDKVERMDREIMNFTYGHTLTSLMLKRAPKIYPQVEPILEKNGLPDDLKYLMTIESNLDENARSVAGAAGLWQFMKGTAGEYGLEISSTVDERYNLEKETEAACKLLKRAYAKYGNWMTVAASYNCGPGNIDKCIKAQGEKDAMNLWLVEETSRYMFRILVAKMLVENPEAFGFNIDESRKYKPVAFKTVTVSEPVTSWAAWAKQHGTDYNQLRRINCWIRDSYLENKSKKTYKVKVPISDR